MDLTGFSPSEETTKNLVMLRAALSEPEYALFLKAMEGLFNDLALDAQDLGRGGRTDAYAALQVLSAINVLKYNIAFTRGGKHEG